MENKTGFSMSTRRSSPANRRFLAAKEPLVNKLRSIAEARSKTLYGLTNEILEQAIRAEELGEELQNITSQYRIIKMAKENRSVLIPERIWYQVLDKALEKNGDLFKESFYNSGLWYGKYFSTVSSEVASPEGIRNLFKTIFWNASSFEITQNGDLTILTCIEPNFTESHTEFLSTVFEGIMHSLSYQTNEKKVSRGLLMLTFSKNTLGKENGAQER